MSEDMKEVAAQVNAEWVEEVKKRGHGAISELIRSAFRRAAGATAEHELNQAREDLRDTKTKKSKVEADIEAVMDEFTGKVARHSELAKQETRLLDDVERLERETSHVETERDAERDAVLDELTNGLRSGHIFPDHPKVKEAARVHETTPEEIIEIMKERHPDVPDYAFVDGTKASTRWHGIDEEETLHSVSSKRYRSLEESDT